MERGLVVRCIDCLMELLNNSQNCLNSLSVQQPMTETPFSREFRCENSPLRIRRFRSGREQKARNRWRQSSDTILQDISEKENNDNKATQLSSEEATVQICFDFTKGRCARRNCKFSHDFDAIVKYNSREQGICFDFLRGECNRGPLCRFSHDLSNVMKQWATELRGGGTNRQPPCGICYDFVRGQCPRGKKCRFSHDLREIAMATSRPTPERNRPTRSISSPWEQLPLQPRSKKSTDSNDSWRSADVNNENHKSIWASTEAIQRAAPSLSDVSQIDETAKKTTTSTLPLCNIRARVLLGRNLCQALGIPSLVSTRTLYG